MVNDSYAIGVLMLESSRLRNRCNDSLVKAKELGIDGKIVAINNLIDKLKKKEDDVWDGNERDDSWNNDIWDGE